MSALYYQDNDAVYLRNVCKRYGNKGTKVLENLCMNVKKETIYGLLGSSGCGKTTVLSCIVGLRKWDSGELLVLGKVPGTKDSGIPGRKLGYMPQDVALYNQLTIRETIQFYGRVYNMISREIADQWSNLHDLLQLPSGSSLINELSGGQRRRVSLALALTHFPELLVLDEPTVGLEILLRQKIWDHLYKLVSSQGTTIILTTHYIEEAKLANNIGIMRKGRLLVQNSPQNLMIKFQSECLEKIVLQLCQMDESRLKTQQSSSFSGINSFELIVSSPSANNVEHDEEQNLIKNNSSGLCHSFRKIFALTAVFMLTLIRYPAFVVFILFMPSIHGSISLWAVGSKPAGMPLGIVNHELSNWTLECNLPKHDFTEDSCNLLSFSCEYLNQLKTGGVVVLVMARIIGLFHNVAVSFLVSSSCETEEDALHQVHRGEIYGYLTFPYNYSEHTVDLLAVGKFALNESLEGSRIHAHLDYSNYLKTFFVIKSLYDSYMIYIKQLGQLCQIDLKEAEQPLHYRPPVYGSIEDDDLKAYVMPGVITFSIMLIACQLSGLMFISDREQGTLSRGIAAGLGTADVIAGHIITQGIVTICQILIWNLVLKFIFGLAILGSLWLWFVFCLFCGLCGVTFGLLIGILCKDEVESLIVGVFLLLIFILYGGAIYPLEYMSKFLRIVGYLSPNSLPTLSLRSIVVRGQGLTHPSVWPGLVCLVSWIVVLCICNVFALRHYKNK